MYRVGVASSWTSLMKQGDYENKQKRYYEQMKEMYETFDRSTFGRFHNEAMSAAKRIYFLTQVNTKHYDQVRKKEYRRYYRELSLRTRFFIRFEIMAPRPVPAAPEDGAGEQLRQVDSGESRGTERKLGFGGDRDKE